MNLADGLKQLTRMCARYKCANCPMFDIGFCSLGQKDRSANANVKAAAIIEKWAEENPEPVYPKWGEWFLQTCQVGITADGKHDWDGLLLSHIPADLAQKLGIEPKEGT